MNSLIIVWFDFRNFHTKNLFTLTPFVVCSLVVINLNTILFIIEKTIELTIQLLWYLYIVPSWDHCRYRRVNTCINEPHGLGGYYSVSEYKIGILHRSITVLRIFVVSTNLSRTDISLTLGVEHELCLSLIVIRQG